MGDPRSSTALSGNVSESVSYDQYWISSALFAQGNCAGRLNGCPAVRSSKIHRLSISAGRSFTGKYNSLRHACYLRIANLDAKWRDGENLGIKRNDSTNLEALIFWRPPSGIFFALPGMHMASCLHGKCALIRSSDHRSFYRTPIHLIWTPARRLNCGFNGMNFCAKESVLLLNSATALQGWLWIMFDFVILRPSSYVRYAWKDL